MNQPPENWVIVFRSTSEYEVNIVKAMLADNNITAESINSHDSAIDSLNVNREVGLYVHKDDLTSALKIIKDSQVE